MSRAAAFLGLGVFAALLALFAYALISGHDPRAVPSALIGKEAPDFTLPPLEGRPASEPGGLSRADLDRGRVTVVNFWASWCAPCRLEHPLLMALSARSDIDLYGIAYKDTPQAARAYLAALGDPFDKLGLDADGRVAFEFGVYGVPETFVIDAKGRILARHVGEITEAALARHIEPAIARALEAARQP